jgi:hypothetical protein
MNENNIIHIIDCLDVPNIIKLSGTCSYFYDLIKTDPIIKNILIDKINVMLMNELYFDSNDTDTDTYNNILKKIYDVKTKKYFLEKINLFDLCIIKNDYIIKHVIDNAYDLNIRNECFYVRHKSHYPIQSICLHSSKRIIKYSINSGMNIDIDNCKRYSRPITYISGRSTDEDMTDIIKLCIDKNPYIISGLTNIYDPLFTLLFCMSYTQYTSILRYLYCKDKKIILWIIYDYLSCMIKLILSRSKILSFSISLIFISFLIYIYKIIKKLILKLFWTLSNYLITNICSFIFIIFCYF